MMFLTERNHYSWWVWADDRRG